MHPPQDCENIERRWHGGYPAQTENVEYCNQILCQGHGHGPSQARFETQTGTATEETSTATPKTPKDRSCSTSTADRGATAKKKAEEAVRDKGQKLTTNSECNRAAGRNPGESFSPDTQAFELECS